MFSSFQKTWGTLSFGQRALFGVLLAAVLGLGGVQRASGADFFDWLAEGNNGNVPTTAGYVSAPALSDATAAKVKQFLLQQKANGQPLAVKIRVRSGLNAAFLILP